jgi:hypothetical protein
MNTLVISEHLYNLVPKDVDRNKWNDAKLPSLGGYDVILVDLTFKKRRNDQNRISLLHALKGKIEKRDFLSKHNLIVVVVCGSPKQDLKIDIPYDKEDENNTVYDDQPFGSYDFLREIIPEYGDRMVFEEGNHMYNISTIPVNLYLDRYEGEASFLYYDYDPDSEKCVDVIPLAKMKKNGNACIAFECKNGRGLVVVLPSYNVKDKKNACSLLLRICKSYFKKRDEMLELTQRADKSLPEPVREAYIEALSCFNYDLYMASLMMCRKSLEISVMEERQNDKREFLKTRIKNLYTQGILDSNLKDVAMEIVDFGNWGAHAEIHKGKKVTEKDVINVLEFLEIYFDYFYRIQRKLRDSEDRWQQLSSMEDT